MSVAAIAMCKDERDIAEFFVRHMAAQVDELILADNLSTDGTLELLDVLRRDGLPLEISIDQEIAYTQDKKMTALAMRALERGHRWVVCADFDEFWYAPDGRTVADFLAGVSPEVQIVKAQLYNHLPTARDPEGESNPFRRIGWRQREHGALPKVCCRTRPDLRIHMGNHGASTDGTAISAGGLVVRHFSWRTPEQYLRKIRAGERAYAATDMPESTGLHWRMWAGKPDEAVLDHFRDWFWLEEPERDETLLYDPAPWSS